MIKNKRYKMKLAGTRVPVWLTEIASVMDAGDLTSESNKPQIERHDVAQCELETLKPIACDEAGELPQTGRFVIIDNYEIAGGGIVLDAVQASGTLAQKHVQAREKAWDRGHLTPSVRSAKYNQRATLLLLDGAVGTGKAAIAKALEETLFEQGRLAYYLGVSNSLLGDSDVKDSGERDEYLRRLGEISHLFTDAGLILITTVSDLDDYELEVIQTLNGPNDLVVVSFGESRLSRRQPDLQLAAAPETAAAVGEIQTLLQSRNYLPEYYL
jgi:bifunctional enzyme CysN/CysC